MTHRLGVDEFLPKLVDPEDREQVGDPVKTVGQITLGLAFGLGHVPAIRRDQFFFADQLFCHGAGVGHGDELLRLDGVFFFERADAQGHLVSAHIDVAAAEGVLRVAFEEEAVAAVSRNGILDPNPREVEAPGEIVAKATLQQAAATVDELLSAGKARSAQQPGRGIVASRAGEFLGSGQ